MKTTLRSAAGNRRIIIVHLLIWCTNSTTRIYRALRVHAPSLNPPDSSREQICPLFKPPPTMGSLGVFQLSGFTASHHVLSELRLHEPAVVLLKNQVDLKFLFLPSLQMKVLRNPRRYVLSRSFLSYSARLRILYRPVDRQCLPSISRCHCGRLGP